jgi:tetraacyldisaccharide 4'-kinase
VTLAQRVAAAWYAPRITLFAALLWPLSLLYRGVVAVRRGLFRRGVLSSHRLPVPVIVVGNITVGGAGKTPLVGTLAQWLAGRGHRPGIVSRGYGGSARDARAVASGDDPRIVGDEPLLFAALGFPVWIGRDRVAAARGLLAAHPDCNVLLADDGLQHYALARTMEIAVIDAARGFGNGLMLPAGPLREPVSRLASVDAVTRLVPRLPQDDVSRPVAESGRETLMTHEPLPWRNLVDAARVADARAWAGQDVHAVCGTGNPQRFFDMVRGLGIVSTNHPFADHHAFVPADLAFPRAAAILMTQKDAVKCAQFADDRCWYLPLRVVVDPALPALVEDKIRGFQTA